MKPPVISYLVYTPKDTESAARLLLIRETCSNKRRYAPQNLRRRSHLEPRVFSNPQRVFQLEAKGMNGKHPRLIGLRA